MPRNSLNDDITAIVKALVEVGPNPNTIARMTDQKKESTRYRYYHFVLGRGLKVQAMPDYARLGLQRIVCVVSFKQPYDEQIIQVVTQLNEKAYAIGYQKIFMSEDYLLYFEAPDEHIDGIRTLMKKLEDLGILELKEFHAFANSRTPPMRSENYDFLAEEWTFDFTARMKKENMWQPHGSSRVKCDLVDLLILKELHIDANASFAAMAKKLKIGYEKLVWHYNTHVKVNKMVGTYRVRWIKSRYDVKDAKIKQRVHGYVPVALLVGQSKTEEAGRLIKTLENLPFLYFEAQGEEYFGVLYVPHEMYLDMLKHLTPVVSACRSARIFTLDDSSAAQYTFAYQLFDQEASTWSFNIDTTIEALTELVPKVPERAAIKTRSPQRQTDDLV